MASIPFAPMLCPWLSIKALGASEKWGVSRQNKAFVPQTAQRLSCYFKKCKPESGKVGRTSKSQTSLHLHRWSSV